MSDALTASLHQHLPESLRWLERMVGINSFTANAAGVDQLGELTAECFAPLGFEASRARSAHPDYGHHLFLERPNAGAPRVLLVTHLDTVFPPDEEERNDFRWAPSADGSRIYGPGTVDIKGGTALIWLMLQAMRDTMPALYNAAHWVIAANASEEVIAKDFAPHTAARCPDGAAAVLVFEGGPVDDQGWHIVSARKGRAEYRLSTRGRGAHAGSSHQSGLNAITALAPALLTAASLTDYARDLTVNVATVQGGTVLNRVPHEASAELEMRAYDPALLDHAAAALHALTLPGSPTEAALEVMQLGASPAWPGGEGTDRLVRCWEQAAQSMGLLAKATKRGGLSDANYLAPLGPTLDGLGPAGANAHCSERSADGSKEPEYVMPGSFVPKAAMNLRAMEQLLGAGS